MRLGKKRGVEDEGVEVSMSPLIDCVFLLLIFFLVTTMLKKSERRIPVQQPQSTMGVALQMTDDANYVGISRDGKLMKRTGDIDSYGNKEYTIIADLPEYLKSLGNAAKDKPLIIQANKHLYFQDTMRVYDICTIQGFKNVKTTMDSDNFQSKYVKEDTDEAEK